MHFRMHARAAVVGIGASVALAACDSPTPTSEADALAPAHSVQAGGDIIPGAFIVQLQPEASPATVAAEYGVDPRYVYLHAIRGFAGTMSEAARNGLLQDARVVRVEPDRVVTVFGSGTDDSSTWGLDRVDQRELPLNGSYSWNTSGAGVNAYIIDTGIRLTHTDFTGRATSGFDAIDGGSADDCNGHGTHVAGTVGGQEWGVAKSANLIAVRVLDCGGSGTISGVVAGVDWVTANHVKPAIANMSLGGSANSTLDDAVANSIAAGVSYAVAAGNGDFIGRQQDACKYSPARVPEAITIGATDNTDKKASWSNYGDCVDWFAPGVSITSAWYESDTQTNTISGTSMAAPHAAGAAALYLEANPGASPQTVRDALYDATTKGIVTSSSTANNHLLYSLLSADGSTPNSPPVASFTYSCSELACSFTNTSTDSDGSITGSSWAFGDGNSSTATSPSHTYAADGTYTVTLTVTDDAGDTSSSSQSVTVSSGSTGDGITLSGSSYKVKGVVSVDLTWSGATSTSVDVFRNGGKITTTANDGAHTDNTGLRGGGSLTYKVCEAGTSTCSNTITVIY